MKQKELTPEEVALQANGNRPLTQVTKVRHPNTGELLDDGGPWQNEKGEWLPTRYNETTKAYELAPAKNESEG